MKTTPSLMPAVAAPTQITDGIPGTVASAPVTTDFMLALTQLLNENPVAASGEVAPAALPPEAPVDALPSDVAAAFALLPMPVAQLAEQAASMSAQQSGATFDPIEMLGLTQKPDGVSARDAALLQALTERLANVDAPSTSIEAPASPTTATFAPTLETQQASRATHEGPIHRPVHVPVGTPAWADEIGSRLTMMSEKGQHTASLRLSPEHLGPLEIRIAMRDDQASVWFGAAHADTRAAIEHALPRLRELFAAQGMSLADAGVSREPPRQQLPATQHSSNQPDVDASSAAAPVARTLRVGLLDAYA